MTRRTSPPSDYRQCWRCGAWRRVVEVTSYEDGHWACRDIAWCSKQAGVGLGALDADTRDAPKPGRG